MGETLPKRICDNENETTHENILAVKKAISYADTFITSSTLILIQNIARINQIILNTEEITFSYGLKIYRNTNGSTILNPVWLCKEEIENPIGQINKIFDRLLYFTEISPDITNIQLIRLQLQYICQWCLTMLYCHFFKDGNGRTVTVLFLKMIDVIPNLKVTKLLNWHVYARDYKTKSVVDIMYKTRIQAQKCVTDIVNNNLI